MDPKTVLEGKSERDVIIDGIIMATAILGKKEAEAIVRGELIKKQAYKDHFDQVLEYIDYTDRYQQMHADHSTIQDTVLNDKDEEIIKRINLLLEQSPKDFFNQFKIFVDEKTKRTREPAGAIGSAGAGAGAYLRTTSNQSNHDQWDEASFTRLMETTPTDYFEASAKHQEMWMYAYLYGLSLYALEGRNDENIKKVHTLQPGEEFKYYTPTVVQELKVMLLNLLKNKPRSLKLPHFIPDDLGMIIVKDENYSSIDLINATLRMMWQEQIKPETVFYILSTPSARASFASAKWSIEAQHALASMHFKQFETLWQTTHPTLLAFLRTINALINQNVLLLRFMAGDALFLNHVNIINPSLLASLKTHQRLSDIQMAVCLGKEAFDKLYPSFFEEKSSDKTVQIDSQNLLYYAAQFGHVDLMDEFLRLGANVEHTNIFTQLTPLCAAAQNGHAQAVLTLILSGAKVDKLSEGLDVDDRNASALFLAAKKGWTDVVRTLLQHEAPVDTGNNEGKTPLYAAAENGHDSICFMLVNGYSGPKANKELAYKGKKPIDIAREKGFNEIVRSLEEN